MANKTVGIEIPDDMVGDVESAIGGVGYGPYYRTTETAPDTLKWIADALLDLDTAAPAQATADRCSDCDELITGCSCGAACPVHHGAVHGGEAEELRSGIEGLLGDMAAGMSSRLARPELMALLDRVNARDSLAYLEREDIVADLNRQLDEAMQAGAALRAEAAAEAKLAQKSREQLEDLEANISDEESDLRHENDKLRAELRDIRLERDHARLESDRLRERMAAQSPAALLALIAGLRAELGRLRGVHTAGAAPATHHIDTAATWRPGDSA